MQEVISFINNLNLSKDDYIVIGASGGPDSMCLLHILNNLNYKVVATHINHNLREEALDEQEFLKKYCEDNNIAFEVLTIPPYNDKNESFYRKKRYNFYKEIAKKYKANIIMTAHHGDDLIETILMRITRGSHLKGYMGFKKNYMEGEMRIIKPLVFVTKDEILKYNQENAIPFVIDKSNAKDDYTRNRYRHNILPFLKKEDSNIHKQYLKYSEELERASDFIDRCIENAKNDNYQNRKLDLSKFAKLDKFIKYKELEYIMKEVYKDDIDKIKKTHIVTILNSLEEKSNFKLNMPLGIIVERTYDILEFKTHEQDSTPYGYTLDKQIELPNGDKISFVEETSDTSNYTIRLNTKEIKLPLKVRTRKNGDTIEIKNLSGHKKTKSIFIDEKVPRELRDTYPIVTDATDTILWIPGLRKSKFDNEITGKYDIILKYTKGRIYK